MNQLELFISTTEEKLKMQQGQIEIVTGYLVKLAGKDDFMDYLRSVVDHPGFGQEAKHVAAEVLRQDTLWTRELLEGPKQ